jgi:putative oxidoreductase
MAALDRSVGPAEARGLVRFVLRANDVVRAVARPSLAQLALRIGLAIPFWRSGVNKWDGLLDLSDTAILLFRIQFKLHLPGGPYDFPAPVLAAYAAGSAEIVMPLLLVAGLGTRFAATALLLMTAIVQLTVPSGWPLHATWAAMALALMAWGPGAVSVDYWLARSASSPRIPLA